MNPIDTLGGLLKQKTASSRLSGQILKSIVTGGRSPQTPAQESRPVPNMALNLDSQPEVNYLKDLAHGLRLPPALCAQIHQRFGVPPLQ